MSVGVAEFKAKLGRYMKAVRAGQQIVITDRGEPVAKLVPATRSHRPSRLEVSRPRDPSAPCLGDVDVRAIRASGTDTTALLREDRDRR